MGNIIKQVDKIATRKKTRKRRNRGCVFSCLLVFALILFLHMAIYLGGGLLINFMPTEKKTCGPKNTTFIRKKSAIIASLTIALCKHALGCLVHRAIRKHNGASAQTKRLLSSNSSSRIRVLLPRKLLHSLGQRCSRRA